MSDEKDPKGLRLAFSHIRGERWTAGLYYLKNLFHAIRSLAPDEQPEIILVVSEKTNASVYAELSPYLDGVIEWSYEKRNDWKSNFKRKVKKYTGNRILQENGFSRFLKQNHVDVLFTRGAPRVNFTIPILSWIPDFQHLHYPEFFSDQEIINRNISSKTAASRATRVILSSKSALNDYSHIAASDSRKGRVLSFVSQIPEEIYSDDVSYVCRKYHLVEKFILLPNQFWKHKNHNTVVEALELALQENPEITIVCTGNTNEYRDDLYFSELLYKISLLGIRGQMIILGLVPREDLLCLMRQSVAVLQPSLFEGWNSAIEEAKSLGKPLLVSDIPVHREQGNANTTYFQATDASNLAAALVEVFTNTSSGPNSNLERKARVAIQQRTEKYGETFMEIVREAIASPLK